MSKRNHHRKKQKHYSIFEDGSTSHNSQLPQLLLCEGCRSLGYCKLTLPATDNRASTSEPRKVLKKFPFDLAHYKNKIPFRVSKTDGFSESAKKHLQIAYELGNYKEACHMQISIDDTYYPEEDLTPFMEECERLSTDREQTRGFGKIPQGSLSSVIERAH